MDQMNRMENEISRLKDDNDKLRIEITR